MLHKSGSHGSLSSEVVAVVVGTEAVPVLMELVAQASVCRAMEPSWDQSYHVILSVASGCFSSDLGFLILQKVL